jgi:hypothetical protein
MRIYLAGPMSGRKNYNRDAFNEAATNFRAQGHEVVSPVELDEAVYGPEILTSATGDPSDADARGFSREQVYVRDHEALSTCDTIAMLEGWQNSLGAMAEWYGARQLKKKIMYQASGGWI